MPGLGNLVSSQPPVELKLIPQETPFGPNPTCNRESDPEAFRIGSELMDSGAHEKTNGVASENQETVQEKDFDSRSELDEEGEAVERSLKKCSDKCSFPFPDDDPKLVQCGVCQNVVSRDEEILCSVHGCQRIFHLKCAKESIGFKSAKKFKCPQHACFLCKQKNHLWRCIKCLVSCHDKCAPFPEHVVHFPDRPGEAICWKHPADSIVENKEVFATVEDVFFILPLPHYEEFKLDESWKEQIETKLEPHPYVKIKRNVYLVKKKRIDRDSGCTGCNSTQCSEDCVCRVQCISCSKACHCSENCTNRPFQKNKKIQIVKTESCGWGVIAAEPIKKGDFIVEYVGEVINDAMCERRLWDMKDEDAKNFYMCEINKDFVIDATFKGNASRFLNHSCAPNCKLEKWQVEGETRVGVFASRLIEVGEPLTYDYRFVQFGPQVECHCGAPNCRSYLGTKRRILFGAAKTNKKTQLEISWGVKRRRTPIATVGIIIGN